MSSPALPSLFLSTEGQGFRITVLYGTEAGPRSTELVITFPGESEGLRNLHPLICEIAIPCDRENIRFDPARGAAIFRNKLQ